MEFIRQSGVLQRIKTPAGYLAVACVVVGWLGCLLTWIGIAQLSAFPYWNVWNWTVFVMGLPPALHLMGYVSQSRLPHLFSAGIMWWAMPQLLQICLDSPTNAGVAGAVFQICCSLGSLFLHPELLKVELAELTRPKMIVLAVVFVLGLSCTISGGINVSQVENLPSFVFLNGSFIINSTSERATPFLQNLVQSSLTSVYFTTAYAGSMDVEMYATLFASSQLLASSLSIAANRGDIMMSIESWELIKASSLAAGSFDLFLALAVTVICGIWLNKKNEFDSDSTEPQAEDETIKARATNWIGAILYVCTGIALIGAILVWIYQKYGQFAWLAFAMLMAVAICNVAYILGATMPYLTVLGIFMSSFGALSFGMRFTNPGITAGGVLLIIPSFIIWISYAFKYDHEVGNQMRFMGGAASLFVFVGCIIAGSGVVDTPYQADEIAARGGLTALFFLASILGRNKEFVVMPFALGTMLVHSFGGAYSINTPTGQAGSMFVWIGTFAMIFVYIKKLMSNGSIATAVVSNETAPILANNDFPPAEVATDSAPDSPPARSGEEVDEAL